ncbi:MAG TPA: carboxypeptidase regulatory-like domain-containing protein [Candidatus Angelobacter sp.]|nr:carboxypeptidase regulatory-like domain-containing protein [Candidatus Angelobacter sp.]
MATLASMQERNFCVALLFALCLCTSISAQTPAPSPTPIDEFSIVALPDTQFYSSLNPQIFAAQTQWIANHVQDQNIRLVVGLGDIVDSGGELTQWQNADTAVRLLDGQVPYMMAIGNHDYDQNNPAGRTASTKNFNFFFGPGRYAGAPWYKGGFPAGSNENFYGVVKVNGRNYLIIVLEFAARDSALAWADGILKANQDKDAIIVTHMFTYMDNTRISGCDLNSAASFGVGQDNNGEDMWWKLVRKYPNIHLVLSGHVVQGDGTGRRMDLGLNGNLVNQILSDYQSDPLGGGGYLRIMRISLSLNRVSVTSYSPYLDSFKTDDHNQFILPYHNPGISTAPGTLSGKAKSAIDCSPAAGVTVAYSGGSAVTDANGNFNIPANARKSLAITAGKTGWLSDARTGTSTLNAAAEPSPTKIFISTAGQVSGHVLNSLGTPVSGATITLTGGKLRLSKTVTADAAGAYNSGWIAVGAYTVSVAAAGYAGSSASAAVNTGLVTPLDVTLK